MWILVYLRVATWANFASSGSSTGLSWFWWHEIVPSYGGIVSSQDCLKIQNDLVRLARWCDVNAVPLNVNEYKGITLTISIAPVHFAYTVGPSTLVRVDSSIWAWFLIAKWIIRFRYLVWWSLLSTIASWHRPSRPFVCFSPSWVSSNWLFSKLQRCRWSFRFQFVAESICGSS
jgi:hypothetical protein